MLVELTIDDYAIIEHLQVQFGSGFNVLTGETGAGKSIIVDAVATLLGGKLDQDDIRAGAEGTSIEGVFHPPNDTLGHLSHILQELGLGDAGSSAETEPTTIILRRDLRQNGRTVCRINGRAVPLRVLVEVGQYLVDIHGQGEHLLLFRPREQLVLLDRYAGLTAQSAQISRIVRQLREVRSRLNSLRRDERELARRVDLLRYEVQEIESARLSPGEEQELRRERDVLANVERLAGDSEAICALLFEGDGQGGEPAVDLLGRAGHLLSDLSRIDPSQEECRRTVEEVIYELEDVARTMRRYRDGLEFDPKRLDQVESRLALINGLRRKYGDSIEDILVYAERAGEELSSIEHAGERIDELEKEEDSLLWEIGRLGQELSLARQEAGLRLAEAVEGGLSDLKMANARFAIRIEREEDREGAWVEGVRYRFDPSGIDQVEFLVSANPGEPLRPLPAVASGGETSRLMLALKTVLAHADQVPTLVFDEIDSGIGGIVGSLVGLKLRRLSESHQVLCVTHLPQLAAAGTSHFKVEKLMHGGRTVTQITLLAIDERISEIALMMGTLSESTRQSAREMLNDSAGWVLPGRHNRSSLKP